MISSMSGELRLNCWPRYAVVEILPVILHDELSRTTKDWWEAGF